MILEDGVGVPMSVHMSSVPPGSIVLMIGDVKCEWGSWRDVHGLGAALLAASIELAKSQNVPRAEVEAFAVHMQDQVMESIWPGR